ncbi:MAG: hypothetical protein ABIH38_05645 [Patescibacteria group bacterium]
MKKPLLIIIILLVFIIAGGVLYFTFFTNDTDNGQAEISCQDYDDNQSGCLAHSECKWSSDMNLCDSTNTDLDDGNNENGQGLNQELENIVLPDNPSNELCKKLPLSNQSSFGERYYCLALVNHDERFCEGIDEEKARNICLAHAKADSSYCEKIEEVSAQHVCYYMLAVSSEDATFCDDIDYLDTLEENEEEKLQCYYNFVSNLYQWGESDEIKTEYCHEFPASYEDRATCLAMQQRDVSLCGDNPNCLTHFEQPLSFCEGRSDYSSCIKDRAKINKDVSICELLPQPDRDSCVGVYCTHIALEVAVCDMIEDMEKRQEMYIELAMNLANL